jgi:hypothetical protein
MREDDVWHMRCLKCGFGFTFTQLSHAYGERREQADRRAIARSGRRSTDLPRPIACDRCASMDVLGWLRTGDSLWVRCQECGRVQCVAASWGLVGPPPVGSLIDP